MSVKRGLRYVRVVTRNTEKCPCTIPRFHQQKQKFSSFFAEIFLRPYYLRLPNFPFLFTKKNHCLLTTARDHKGPIYNEKSSPVQEGDPSTLVNFSERLYEVEPFSTKSDNNAGACSDCLASIELTRRARVSQSV